MRTDVWYLSIPKASQLLELPVIIFTWTTQGRQSWGFVTPRFWAGGRGRVWENTISYFELKVKACWKVIIFPKKEEKFGKNVGVNGRFCDKWEIFELTTKRNRSSEIFALKIGNLKISQTGSTTPRLRNRLTPLEPLIHSLSPWAAKTKNKICMVSFFWNFLMMMGNLRHHLIHWNFLQNKKYLATSAPSGDKGRMVLHTIYLIKASQIQKSHPI